MIMLLLLLCNESAGQVNCRAVVHVKISFIDT